MFTNVHEFLYQESLLPDLIDIPNHARRMAVDMQAGLAGKKSDMPMIPTYVGFEGDLTEDSTAIVIDAGGTNFRTGFASVKNGSIIIENVSKMPMPGIRRPATWEEFITFIVDNIEPLLKRTNNIGFCFSYAADVNPNLDGCVQTIDKEVHITGAEGKYVAESINLALTARGYKPKKIVIINDTVAALLGGALVQGKNLYSGFIGQISGTGTNTCCIVPTSAISKVRGFKKSRMLINMEAGCYSGFPRGEADRQLDAETNEPGCKLMEKLGAGVYLGRLSYLAACKACDCGIFSFDGLEKLKVLGNYNAAAVNAWADSDFTELRGLNSSDREFLTALSNGLLERSAASMAANLVGIALLTSPEEENRLPICICAEGSLVQNSRIYRDALTHYLNENSSAVSCEFRLSICSNTTLPGAAIAVMTN